MIFYTNLFIPKRFAGYTFGPISLIRPSYRGDVGLVAHERTHQRQFWHSFGLHPLLYWLDESYRLECEIEAYAAQLIANADGGASLRFYAQRIADLYDLDVTLPEAVKLLTMQYQLAKLAAGSS